MLFLTTDARLINLPSVSTCRVRDRKMRCYDADGRVVQTLTADAFFIYGHSNLYMRHAAEVLFSKSQLQSDTKSVRSLAYEVVE